MVKTLCKYVCLATLSLLSFCFVFSSCTKDELNIVEPSENQFKYSVAFSVGPTDTEGYFDEYFRVAESAARQYNEIVQGVLEQYNSNFDESIIDACDAFYKTQHPLESEAIFTIHVYKYIEKKEYSLDTWQQIIKEYPYGNFTSE